MIALLWTSAMAFMAAVITWATNLYVLYNASIGPYSNFKKWSLEKISLHKGGKCINPLNLHLFQESIQNWQLKRTKTRIEFHLQGYFSAVSPSLQTPNSRAWKGSNKFPSNTVMCLSAWKNTESQGRKWRHLLHLVSGPLRDWALLISQWIWKVFSPLYHLQNQMGEGLGVLFHLYFLHFCT